jgi:hypothetical protein
MSSGTPNSQVLSGDGLLRTKAETMLRRRIVLADGRYLIFFTFIPAPPEVERNNFAKE